MMVFGVAFDTPSLEGLLKWLSKPLSRSQVDSSCGLCFLGESKGFLESLNENECFHVDYSTKTLTYKAFLLILKVRYIQDS